MDNLHEHLVSSLQGCHSLLLQNYSGQHFIRVIPSTCDQTLEFFPLVEARLTQHQETVTISVVTFRRELLETSETRNKTQLEEIAEAIRRILFDNKYRICKVSGESVHYHGNIFHYTLLFPGIKSTPGEKNQLFVRALDRRRSINNW